jgi:nitrite reductase/ring-hydroxylating ferredoxin subunit
MLVRLCDKSFIPNGELRSIKVKGHEVLAANLDGKIYCLEGRCTHAGAPLAEGSLEGEVLTCPWHYSQFNVTSGAVLRGPAYKPLRAYAAVEKGNAILIEL